MEMEELYNMDETPVEKVSENEEKHLNHPFYAEANQYRETVRREQVLKGAHKYPEPFTTASWTNQEIIDHAMQENVDQAHYIYAAKERMEELEKEIEWLKGLIKTHEEVGDGYHKEIVELKRELTRAENTAGEYQKAYKNVCTERDEFKRRYLKAHVEIQELQYQKQILAEQLTFEILGEKKSHDCSKNQAIHWQGKDIVKVKCQICDKTLYQA
jgi:chromosome segregation ATPase